jgi:transcription elongation factor Elf1
MVDNHRQTPHEPERFLSCPKCNAVSAKAETLGRTLVYVRCSACGETWTIAERRKAARAKDRSARFPIVPPAGV